MYQTHARRRGAPTGRRHAGARPRREVGLGVRIVATSAMLGQGELHQTGNPLDVAIEGHGFFQVELPNGETGVHPRRRLQHRRRGPPGHQRGLPARRRHHDPARRAVGDDRRRRHRRRRRSPATRSRRARPASSSPRSPTRPGLVAQGKHLFRRPPRRARRSLGAPGEGGAGTLRRARSSVRTSTSSRR